MRTISSAPDIDTTIPHPATWATLPPDQLLSLKNRMYERWLFLAERNISYAAPLEEALEKIDALLTNKVIKVV